MKKDILQNYPGAKSGSGVTQWLINNIPAHDRYFELFAGSAQLYKAKKPAEMSILADIDNSVCDAHRKAGVNNDVAFIYHKPALEMLTDYDSVFVFRTDDFIFLDPPYPKKARRAGRSYYKFEMLEDADHVELLSAINDHPSNIMISTRQNELYDIMLKGWRKETFQTMDRAGKCEEIIYMNYDKPEFLHQYDYVGLGFSDRQRVKRKIDRFASKISMLPVYERQMFIQEMIKNDRAAVEFFLTMTAAGK